MHKNLPYANFQLLGVFQVGWTSLLPPMLQFYKNYTQNLFFFFKKSIFAFLAQHFGLKDNSSKPPLNLCTSKCTYLGNNHFNFISVWSEIMSL